MVKTVVSILLSFALILGISVYEIVRVNGIFETFGEYLTALYEKSENATATHEDGKAVKAFWDDKKKSLHVWIPHTSIESVDYQLNEALGYLYEEKYDDALPKIEVLTGMCKSIPSSYSFAFENIF